MHQSENLPNSDALAPPAAPQASAIVALISGSSAIHLSGFSAQQHAQSWKFPNAAFVPASASPEVVAVTIGTAKKRHRLLTAAFGIGCFSLGLATGYVCSLLLRTL